MCSLTRGPSCVLCDDDGGVQRAFPRIRGIVAWEAEKQLASFSSSHATHARTRLSVGVVRSGLARTSMVEDTDLSHRRPNSPRRSHVSVDGVSDGESPSPSMRLFSTPLMKDRASTDSRRGAVHSIATNWVSTTFMSGTAILFPVVITITATKWLIEFFDSMFSPLYESYFNVEIFGACVRAYFRRPIRACFHALPLTPRPPSLSCGASPNARTHGHSRLAGLGFVTAVGVIFFAGILGQSWLGSLLIRFSEWVMMKVPVVTQIYSATKQIGQALDPHSENAAFKECVLLKHPKEGEYALGFVTGECVLQGESEGRPLIIVYVPTNHMVCSDRLQAPQPLQHPASTLFPKQPTHSSIHPC